MAGWRLFTGVTGLLGQYLLWDALLKREPVAVLVRSRQGISPTVRIDRLLSAWETRFGKFVLRPVVLDGDIGTDDLALSDSAAKWFRDNVTSVVHSAASVSFQETPKGEPLKSNVTGTQHLLDFCRTSNVRDFHFVSTAFTCGLANRKKPVLEELHPEDGPFGNIYERSKCLAEHLVINSAGDFTRTIHRPSTIIGDSQTGYSPNFNAIYTPLRLAWNVVRESPLSFRSEQEFLAELGVDEIETRNIVPVDWVSRAIMSIVREPKCHGRIYHLTNNTGTDGKQITSAMVRAVIANLSPSQLSEPVSGKHEPLNLAGFAQHMEVYRSHFHSDPTFDTSEFSKAGVCPPSPPVDEDLLFTVFEFAVRARFRSPVYPKGSSQNDELRGMLEFDDGQTNSAVESIRSQGNSVFPDGPADGPLSKKPEESDGFHLLLSGSGGGCWRVVRSQKGIQCVRPERQPCEGPHIWGAAYAFRNWLNGQCTIDQTILSGQLVPIGNQAELESMSRILLELRSAICASNPVETTVAQARLEPVSHNQIEVRSKSC